MIKKVATVCICVFLAVVLIGAVVYPTYSIQDTITAVASKLSIFRVVVEKANYYIMNFIDSATLFDKDKNLEDVEKDLLQADDIFNRLSVFVPYHLNKYDLVSRCTNQGFNIFTTKITDIHNDHKIALLCCYLDDQYLFGDFQKSNFLVIFYCGVCEKICCVTITRNNSGTKYLYPFDKKGEDFDVFLGMAMWYANTFKYSEVLTYLPY